MPATATVSPTGDPYVDAVISGVKWAVNSFTYSFPTDASYYGSNYGSGEPSNGFEAFNAAQQNAVRAVLAMYSAVANVTFTEITETPTQHADLRYAESSTPTTAWAYYPTTSPEGGDAWFSHTYYNTPVMGNYAFDSMIHETGHAMGLKHPQETSGAFSAMPADHDSLEYSVMSYHSYLGSGLSGYTNGSTSYPQTLMMYDIAALQVLYGANYATNAGDTVYSWSPTTGQELINGFAQTTPAGNKIFMTTWDGGGNDTYDFSKYTTNLSVNLQPGGWTTVSSTQLAALGGGHHAAGNIANSLLYDNNPASLIENAIGGSGNDTITGNVANNHLTGGGGNDILNGVSGTNTADYAGNSTDYSQVQNTDGSWTVTDLRAGSPDGTDTLTNIQDLQFADGVVALGDTGTPVTPDTDTAPVANDDAYEAVAGTTLSVAAGAGVLANDADAEHDPLTAALVSGPSHGSLTLNGDGSFKFTPDSSFSGSDSFSYKVSDGTYSDTGTATITVDPAPNVAPVANDDTYTAMAGTTLDVPANAGVLANDTDANGDALTAILVNGPSHGLLTLNGDGSFSFTAAGDFSGNDSFTYMVSDGTADSAVATASITVDAPNTAPVALDDSYSTNYRTALSVDAAHGVLANDTDANGDPLTAVLVSAPSGSQGKLSLNPDGSFQFTPGNHFTGTTSFSYQTSDGQDLSSVATVTIAVGGGRGGGGGGHTHGRLSTTGGGGRVHGGIAGAENETAVPHLSGDQTPAPPHSGWASGDAASPAEWNLLALWNQAAVHANSGGYDGADSPHYSEPIDLIGVPDYHHTQADFGLT